jgi:hypothetical protein
VYSHVTITLLAIHRYKLDKGRFPASLEELVEAGYLKEVPIDPYSDRPIVYKPAEEDFILYSIGPDFKDDGGQVSKNKKGELDFWAREGGDIVFWPAQKEKSAKSQLSESSRKK